MKTLSVEDLQKQLQNLDQQRKDVSIQKSEAEERLNELKGIELQIQGALTVLRTQIQDCSKPEDPQPPVVESTQVQ